MTKLFYDDPLKAAIMERDYGVKLYWVDDPNLDHVAISFDNDDFAWVKNNGCSAAPYMWEKWEGDETFYIHPDSYGIFLPMDGDENIDGWVYNAKTKQWDHKVFNHSWTGDKDIDKRNGKQFFMPMSEHENHREFTKGGGGDNSK